MYIHRISLSPLCAPWSCAIEDTKLGYKKISCKINELLLNNPSYLVWIDNGRYNSFQLEEINKKKFIQNGFTEYNDMFVFGEVK